MANGYYTIAMLDHGGEKSSFTIQTGAVTSVSLPSLLTQVGTFRGAVEGITLGTVQNEALKVFDTALSNTLPADQDAQRERKWLVRYQDVLPFFDDPVNAIPNEGYGRVFVFSIPTADISGRLLANTDKADLTDTEIAAFVAAYEDMARSPYGGTVEVLGINAVGRNL